MCDQKCVVEGCNLDYDVTCSFSFYNANITSDNETKRQEWIEGAMHEQSELLWRHVSLQLCGYHFELDTQGLWIDSPMLPELLMSSEPEPTRVSTEAEKKGPSASGYQGLFEKFIEAKPGAKAAEIVRMDHSYSAEPQKDEPDIISRLNVRNLVDTLGYLSLKNIQRKQLWVVKVETDKNEASISQSEHVIKKMQDPKQIIEIVPQTASASTSQGAVLQIMEDGNFPDNCIFEIAQEQEITMDEVKEIPPTEDKREWMVNIIPEEAKPKYAYIKHCMTGKKKRHFTADMNEITLHTDFENYYILPDVDPSVGVEVTTSYEPENYIVEEYQHLVLEDRPRKRKDTPDSGKRKKKKFAAVREQQEQIQIKTDQDWVIDNSLVYEQDEDYDDPKKAARVRRKNKKYLGYDFVT